MPSTYSKTATYEYQHKLYYYQNKTEKHLTVEQNQEKVSINTHVEIINVWIINHLNEVYNIWMFQQFHDGNLH